MASIRFFKLFDMLARMGYKKGNVQFFAHFDSRIASR